MAKKKKILFISQYNYPHVGGVEKHMAGVHRILLRQHYCVYSLTSKHESWLSTRQKMQDLLIERFAYPQLKYLGLLYIWFEIFKKRNLIAISDVVHIHDVAIWYLPFKFLYPKKKVFLTIHGWETVYPVPLKNKLLKQLSMKISNGSIIVGKYLEKYYGIKGDKVIYGAIDPEKIMKKKKDLKLIIYVGRLAKDTGLEIFLNALSNNKTFNIEFCGDGPLVNECKKYGKVHGFVDPTPFMAKAAICFSSGYLTIIESLANKCIVIAAYNNQIRKDILEMTPFTEWIIKVNSVKEVVKTLEHYKKNNRKFSKNIENGYAWAIKQTWEKVTNEYLNLWASK